jgi:putative transposase
VVFNDVIRVRTDAYQAGEKISPAEVQRRVITRAKATEARGWLVEVASVALVQAVQDAHRAYANFFESLKGARRGRKVGHPRFKSGKDSRQSFRLTRNGFTIRPNGRLYVAKVGDVQVRWSRDLPSVPSSVTIIREPDGHYYASFVVDIAPIPLPVIGREAGVDLGITRLATIADTDGTRRDVENPKFLKCKQRKLARLEREMSRRSKGGKNRAKSRRAVAVQHGKVSRARLDYHHKQALILVRDNQASHVEDLNITGMLGNRRLAGAICDAGWAQFVRLLYEKAERYGRTVAKVSRWLPSSKMCSTCGHVMDNMPLKVRLWVCPQCAATHDRDYNAARNILAAGQAERLNAGGAHVSPPSGRQRVMKQEPSRRGVTAWESSPLTARRMSNTSSTRGYADPVGHREQLLAAARRLLEEKGYAHITARDLVAASDTNLASIGYHFGSKAELLSAAIGEVLEEWTTTLATIAMADPTASPIERATTAWAAMLKQLPNRRPLLLSFMEALAQAEREPKLREQFAGHYRRCRAQVAKLVAESLGLPDPDGDPRCAAIASFVIAVCDGLAVQCLLDPERTPDPDTFRFGLATLFAMSASPAG